MDITLLILLILFPILILIIGWRLIAYYLSDDFQKGFFGGKFVFLISVTVALVAICFFPLDVANAGGSPVCGADGSNCSSIPFKGIWYTIFILIALLLVVICPFTVFFYETMDIDEPPMKERIRHACCYTLGTIVVVALLSLLFCMIVKNTDIDIVSYNVTADNTFILEDALYEPFIADPDSPIIVSGNLTEEEIDAANNIIGTAATLSIPVSIVLRIIAMICILGWLFFVIFAGIGIVGLPYKLIYAFINRPTYMPKDKFEDEKKEIAVRIQALIAEGESISQMMDKSKHGNFGWKEKRAMKKQAKQATEDYRQEFKKLDEDYLKLRAEHLNYQENNPLIPFAKLVLGIISIVVSILWIVHLGLYVFPKQMAGFAVSPFLNSMFIALNEYFPIIASLLLLLFALYFMFCTMNGAFSFGLRMFLMNVHEMEPHDTLITSLVFNGGLILLVVLPVLQFCSKAFADYASESEIIKIEYLQYVSWLFKNNVFLWIMLAFILLSATYYSCRRSDKERKTMKTMKKLKAKDDHQIELKKMKAEEKEKI